MITDETAIKIAKKLQKYCEGSKGCCNCVFYCKGTYGCGIEELPHKWSIEPVKNSGDDK